MTAQWNGVTIIPSMTKTSGFLNFSRKKETISNQKRRADTWKQTLQREIVYLSTLGWSGRRKIWQPALGHVTPTFFCQEAAVGQPSGFCGVRGTFRKPTWHSQQRYTWRDSEKGAVLLVHKSRTVENNLIAFQVDYVFTRNLFSWVFCLDKNGKIIIRSGLWEISRTKWDETKLSRASKCCLCCHSSPRNGFRVPNHLFLSHLISLMWINPSLIYLPWKDSHLRLYNLVHALAILNFS